MYYEEKIIYGKTVYRTSPDGEWKPVYNGKLTKELSSLRQENERLRESLITFSGQFRAIKDLTKERKPRLKQIAKAAEMGVLAVRSVLDGADVVEAAKAARQALTKEG